MLAFDLDLLPQNFGCLELFDYVIFSEAPAPLLLLLLLSFKHFLLQLGSHVGVPGPEAGLVEHFSEEEVDRLAASLDKEGILFILFSQLLLLTIVLHFQS